MAIWVVEWTASMDEKALGRRLQLARQRAGLTQQELCQVAGLSYSTLAKIERGAIKSPSVFTVAAIAGATHTSVEELLDLKNASAAITAPADAKKRSKTGVRFVYFDIDNVLLSIIPQVFTAVARDAGMGVEQIENVFWRYNDPVCRGQMSAEDFNATLAKDFHLDGFDWRKYYLENAEPIPVTIELFKWVGVNYEVGLISNHMPGLTDMLLERDLVPNVGIKTVVDSCKVGAVKPEAKIYAVAQERAGFEPREIMLIDDLRPNLTGADHAGWQIAGFDSLRADEGTARIREKLAF